MAIVRCLVALLIVLAVTDAEVCSITNSGRRKVEVPHRIEGVLASGPPAAILLLMLAPEKMTGWPNPPSLRWPVPPSRYAKYSPTPTPAAG
jgi:iron complex transport system substrate-binding protein